jgi:hypothetical protein
MPQAVPDSGGRIPMIGSEPADKYNIGCDSWNIPFGIGGIDIENDMEMYGLSAYSNHKDILSSLLPDRPDYHVYDNFPPGRYTFSFYPNSTSNPLLKYISVIFEDVANIVFAMDKNLFSIGNFVLAEGFQLDIVQKIIKSVSDNVKILLNRQGDLWFLIITFGMIALLGYSSFMFLKGKIGDTVKALGISLLGVALALFFYSNSAQVLTTFDEGTNAVTGVIVENFGLLSQGSNQYSGTPLNKGLAIFGDRCWDIMIGKPWAYAMFGTYDLSKLKMTPDEFLICSGVKNQNDLDVYQSGSFWDNVKAQFNNLADIFKRIGADSPQVDLSKAFADSSLQWKTSNPLYIDTLYLSTPAIENHSILKMLPITGNYAPDTPRDFIVRMLASTKWGWLDTLDHGGHPNTPSTLNYMNVSVHLLIALIMIVPCLLFALVTISIGGSMIIYQVGLALLLLFLPFVCLLMFVPVSGWQIAVKYFKTFLGFLLVKVIYGLYLSALIALVILVSDIVF